LVKLAENFEKNVKIWYFCNSYFQVGEKRVINTYFTIHCKVNSKNIFDRRLAGKDLYIDGLAAIDAHTAPTVKT